MPREMKDSGIEWIGKIPKEWNLVPAKYLIEIKKRIAGKEGYTVLSITQSGIKPKDITSGEGQLAESYANYQFIHPGEFGMNHMDLLTGWIDISNYFGVVSPDYRVFEIHQSQIDKRYLLYLYQMCYKNKIFYGLGQGAALMGRWRLPATNMMNMKLPVPPIDEQTKIADYLEHKCSQIDSLASNIESQITKLDEYRKALITQVVTKGLDPNAEMKDSGIEWIGEIPKGWLIGRLKHTLESDHPYPIGDGDHGLIKSIDYVDEGIPFIRVQNLSWYGNLNLANLAYITTESNQRIKSSILRPGDILIAKTGATIGKTALVPKSMPVSNTTSHVGKITVGAEYDARYIKNVLSSAIVQAQLKEMSEMQSTRPELGIEGLKNIILTLPPFHEQVEIADYILGIGKRLDSLTILLKSELKKTDDLKKSLIFDFVTGKKKVPADFRKEQPHDQ